MNWPTIFLVISELLKRYLTADILINCHFYVNHGNVRSSITVNSVELDMNFVS